MAEFLKNNPMALRHCLLYEFLQTKKAKKAYSNFIEAVGDDVINAENFEFWFDRFSKGKFDEDDDKKPISAMKNYLRNDEKAIRACILYHYLNTNKAKQNVNPKNDKIRYCHTTFHVYLKMCKVIGNDIIDYQEFDFWYFRFVNGEFDLDYDRSLDPPPATFSDLPIDVIGEITDKLGYLDRVRAGKVCKNLREVLKNRSGSYEKISIDEAFARVSLEFDGNRVCYTRRNWVHSKNGGVYYRDCAIFYQGKYIKRLEGNYMDLAFADLSFALKNPKFKVDLLDLKLPDDSKCLEFMKSVSESSKLSVKKVNMDIYSYDTMASILTCLKPGNLETIENSCLAYNASFDLLTQTEQWKQAKYYDGNESMFPSFHYFFHFQKFEIFAKSMKKEDVERLLKGLSESVNFNSCDIFIGRKALNELAQAVEERELEEPSDWNFHYSVPGSNDFLKIEVTNSGSGEYDFCVEKVEC